MNSTDLQILIITGGLFIPVLAFISWLSYRHGDKKRRIWEEALQKDLPGFKLQHFYRKAFWIGTLQNHTVIVHLQSKTSKIIRIKLKSSKKLYLAVKPSASSKELRNWTGWENPEPGFYLHSLPQGPSKEENLSHFARLRSGTKRQLLQEANACESLSLSPDWTNVLIGKEKALQFYDENETLLASPELMLQLPHGTSVPETVAKIAPLLKELEADLT
ncbi:hypothetical protein IPG41_03460 [Candidatus Peregrinibacteria bacterium]|nr:MAG: hypothetical protein IPG41_03460 [Candidatus Peregrinibacteria bacterium]